MRHQLLDWTISRKKRPSNIFQWHEQHAPKSGDWIEWCSFIWQLTSNWANYKNRRKSKDIKHKDLRKYQTQSKKNCGQKYCRKYYPHEASKMIFRWKHVLKLVKPTKLNWWVWSIFMTNRRQFISLFLSKLSLILVPSARYQ